MLRLGSCVLLVLLAATSALRLPGRGVDGLTRRDALGISLAAATASSFPTLSGAEEEAVAATITYADFLEAAKNKKIKGVVFMPPSGDVAYALIGEGKFRVGEGWPIEVSNSWSSPTYVARILQNLDVPYVYAFDLQTSKPKTYPKPGERVVPAPYVPSMPGGMARPEAAKPPKMYGQGETEEDRLLQTLMGEKGRLGF